MLNAARIRRRPPLWLVALALLAPFALPIPAALGRVFLLWQVGDLLHVALPLLLTLVLHARGPLRGRPLAAGAAAFAAAAAMEGVQALVGRSPRLIDAARDLHGVVIALGWLRWRARGERLTGAALLLLILAVPAQLATLPAQLADRREARELFPLLADHETEGQRRRWGDSDGGRLAFPAAPGRGLVLQLRGGPPDRYPGAVLSGFPRDWRGWTHLEWLARAPGLEPGDSLVYGVRFEDYRARRDGAWAAVGRHAAAEWRRESIALDALPLRPGKRPLRRDDLMRLLFFLPQPQQEILLQIDDVRLR